MSRPVTNDCRLHLSTTVVCARHGGWKAAPPGRTQGDMAGEGEGEGASPVGARQRDDEDGALVLY